MKVDSIMVKKMPVLYCFPFGEDSFLDIWKRRFLWVFYYFLLGSLYHLRKKHFGHTYQSLFFPAEVLTNVVIMSLLRKWAVIFDEDNGQFFKGYDLRHFYKRKIQCFVLSLTSTPVIFSQVSCLVKL